MWESIHYEQPSCSTPALWLISTPSFSAAASSQSLFLSFPIFLTGSPLCFFPHHCPIYIFPSPFPSFCFLIAQSVPLLTIITSFGPLLFFFCYYSAIWALFFFHPFINQEEILIVGFDVSVKETFHLEKNPFLNPFTRKPSPPCAIGRYKHTHLINIIVPARQEYILSSTIIQIHSNKEMKMHFGMESLLRPLLPGSTDSNESETLWDSFILTLKSASVILTLDDKLLFQNLWQEQIKTCLSCHFGFIPI